MDMAARYADQRVFHLTGQRAGEGLLPLARGTYRPALLARYRAPLKLRYDFPLVLLDGNAGDAAYTRSLTSIVNELLRELAPRGIESERMRRLVLRAEVAIKRLLANGGAGRVSELWAGASAQIAHGEAETAAVLARVATALPCDGELLDCTPELPARLLTHAWRSMQAERAGAFHAQAGRLRHKLEDILRAAYVHSAAGQQPDALRAGFGDLHADVFDFAAVSRLVTRAAPRADLPAARRARIERALGVLRAQRFYADADGYTFEFDNCEAALAAWRERLPHLVDVVKALAIAELEARNAYVEVDHDPFFERFGVAALTADDLALFPDYLVCIPPEQSAAPDNATLLEMLSSAVPAKVLVEHRDLLLGDAPGQGHFAFGVRSVRLATTAIGLGGMFVLQSAASNLYALRDRVRQGMSSRGPALFSVYAASAEGAGVLTPYLASAAAMESRAFPAFTFDAGAGTDWATRFSLDNNGDPAADGTVEDFDYADDAMQRVGERVAFTFADYALADPRYASHVAVLPRARWSAALLPAADWLRLPEATAAEHLPDVLAVDAQDRLHRVLIDAPLTQAARRCLSRWHRVQEHGGVHNSHAELAVARARREWEARRAPAEPPPVQTAAIAQPVAVAESQAAAAATDDPWIETSRCSSCNECRNINPVLFGYNENQQAFIKDASAGTYRQLVEAAEACQVAIVHPGKPKNPHATGLDELLERAKRFA